MWDIKKCKEKIFFWRTYRQFIDWCEQVSQIHSGSLESSDANLGHSSELAHAVGRGVVTYLQLCMCVCMCIHICTYIYLPSASQNGPKQCSVPWILPCNIYIYTHYIHLPRHKPSYEFSGRTKVSKHYQRTN